MSFLEGAKCFSKLDILKGYYQVPVNPDDIPKTAVTVLYGTFTFNFNFFDLLHTGATFHRMMDGILTD